MLIKKIPIKDIKPYANNPRKNDDAVADVLKSIENYDYIEPIVLDKDYNILAGHTRYKALLKQGKYEEIECVVAEHLTSQKAKEYRLVDNKVAEKSFWDDDLLKQELEELEEMGSGIVKDFDFDTDCLGLSEGVDENNETKYTKKVSGIQYTPSDEDVSLDELVDINKQKELKKEILSADLPKDVKDFLILASYRHIVFDYGKIADYYAKAPKNVQELFEKSALVIIDFEDAIQNGYVMSYDLIESLHGGANEDESKRI